MPTREGDMKSPKELLRSLLTDVKRLEPDVKGLERDLNTLELRFEHEGFSFFAVTLASLCDALDRGLASGCFACPSGFKKIRSGALPVFLQGLLCKVFDAKTGHLLECPSTGAIKCLRETLRLFKKTRDDSDREDILDRLACDEFVKTDENASSFILSSRHLDLLDRVSRSVLPYLRLRDLGESTFKHGPGGVYERVVGNQKWLTLVDELRKESDYMEQFGYSDFVSTMVLGDITTPWTETIQQPTCLDAYKRASSGIARLVTVAKNSTSRRTITVEPLLNQFVQQGLNTVLREEISRCTILNRCLALTDQSKN
jgi:hypothetical protein